MRVFITGTDTSVGKTTATVGILNYFASQQAKTIGLKLIASGDLVGGDVDQIQRAATVSLSRNVINPYAFELPIAPHLAAREEDVTITVKDLVNHYQQIPDADVVIVEGAGGWLTPLNDNETYADFVSAINIPVILVVGMRLGCVNHSLLTVENILKRNLKLAGWIANVIDPEMLFLEENIETLQTRIPSPMLARVPYSSNPSELKINIQKNSSPN